jgi:hypothetical protein
MSLVFSWNAEMVSEKSTVIYHFYIVCTSYLNEQLTFDSLNFYYSMVHPENKLSWSFYLCEAVECLNGYQ